MKNDVLTNNYSMFERCSTVAEGKPPSEVLYRLGFSDYDTRMLTSFLLFQD
jgi:hypothetical protein